MVPASPRMTLTGLLDGKHGKTTFAQKNEIFLDGLCQGSVNDDSFRIELPQRTGPNAADHHGIDVPPT